MRSLVHDLRQEASALHKIPLFNPRFREVYRRAAVVVILALALALLALGIWWLAPWLNGYTPKERKNIWFGVVVMPFAAVLVSSFVVEFVLKAVHVGFWAISGALKTTTQGRILGWVTASLLGGGGLLSLLGGDLDLWGYLSLFIGVFAAYWFVTLTWEETDEASRLNQKAPATPGSSDPLGV
jgi:hypothetical protein